ncbi:hypothetical protein B0H15DRAFT_950406 [Mycena belliarum]|uniref:Uncharacterized protein n=1 Tax=Mycena belliarum TaxID=1033014 RepID=A0AAD6XQD6_9AGAR|nr:hypothetical protein B0H15DRAFT_950406 [Mycena belliae]
MSAKGKAKAKPTRRSQPSARQRQRGHAPDNPPEAGSSSQGHKRRRDSSPTDEPPPKKKSAPAPAPTQTPAPRTAPRTRADRKDPYHIRNGVLDEGGKTVQTSLHVHLCIMLGIYSGTDVPELPTPAQLAAFQRRFTTADTWDAFVDDLPTDHSAATDKIRMLRLSLSRRTGTIARSIAEVDEEHLSIIFSAILGAGLLAWRPDILGGTPESPYNRAHEDLAISTFQTVATDHGYLRLNFDLTRIKDRVFLKKLYRNFTYSMMKKRLRQEAVEPGTVVLRSKKTNTYKGRASLAKSRTSAIYGDGWPLVVGLLTEEAFSNSEDEFDSARNCYIIKPKARRSATTTQFIRGTVDPGRAAMSKSRGRQTQFRTRVVDPDAQPSTISDRLPVNVPIDYFDPAFFNALPARLRAQYRKNAVALPAMRHWLNGKVPNKFKTMDGTHFMAVYGNEVLAQYNIPTEEEIEQMRANGEDPDGHDDDDDDEGDDDNDDEDNNNDSPDAAMDEDDV